MSENLEDPIQTAQSAQVSDKVDVLLKAAGDAPIMKKKKWAVLRNQRISWVTAFIRRYIKLEESETLFLYVNQAFAPSPDTEIGVLFDCFSTEDPFAEEGEAKSGGENLIHIRIQQRNGRKTLTTVQGIAEKYDKKKIIKSCKKEFACNGTVVEHEQYGEVIQLQGDQRDHIAKFLVQNKLAAENQIKVHGF